jgi:hypothetical protein
VSDLWSVLGSLLAFVVPMALAWWLLGRPARRDPRDDARRRRGKMPP